MPMQACLASNVCGWQAALDGKPVYSGNALKKPPYMRDGYGLRLAKFHQKITVSWKTLGPGERFRFLGETASRYSVPWHERDAFRRPPY